MDKETIFMCEMQAEFFSFANKKFPCSSSFFIAKYMNSDFAKTLDRSDDFYNAITYISLISSMNDKYPSLKKKGQNKYTDSVIHWIGYTYRAWSTLKKRPSYKIYKIIDAEEMASLYNSFHTFSTEYCVERLEEIALERKGPVKSDYEIFKEVLKQNKLKYI